MAVDFEVYYLRNFIFEFSINYNWSRSQLYFLKKKVGHGRFEHRYMENWMDRAHGLWEIESE